MLTWDEDVKPTPQAPIPSGLHGSREALATFGDSQMSPAAAPAARTATPSPAAHSPASSAQATVLAAG